MTSTMVAGTSDSGCCGEQVEVTVNRHRLRLRAGSLAGLELKQEAVAQGAELQVGFDLWVRREGHYAAVYDDDLVEVCDGQEFLAVSTDDHGWPPPRLPAEREPGVAGPSADGWSLVLAPRLWTDLFRHLLADGGGHAAVLLADLAIGSRGPKLLGRELIPAVDDVDYIEGSTGYRSLTSEFIRDAVLRARDDRLAYLAVHNRQGNTAARFSHVDLASHERGYPALRRITGQVVGALVLTKQAAAGDLWLPDGSRDALAQVVVPADRVIRLRPHLARPVTERGRHGRSLPGEPGEETLGLLRVGVVGLGGVGSLVVELLARLGVGELVLVDAELVAEADLPRLAGAEPGDVGAPRVRVAARNVVRANPKSSVEALSEAVESPMVWRGLTRCDWIFLATAGQSARHRVNMIVHRHLVPATQVEVSGPAGPDRPVGRPSTVVRVLLPGTDCLWCDGTINPAELGQHEEDGGRDHDGVPPGVISYDCLAAAEAVNHFLAAVTARPVGDSGDPAAGRRSGAGCAVCASR